MNDQIGLYYWESDGLFHLEPEPLTQEKVIKVIQEYAKLVEGRSGKDVLDLITDPNDKLWREIKLRVMYIMEQNKESMDKNGDTLLPVATWLDGFGAGINLGSGSTRP